MPLTLRTSALLFALLIFGSFSTFPCFAGDYLGPQLPPPTESRKAEIAAEVAIAANTSDGLWQYLEKWRTYPVPHENPAISWALWSSEQRFQLRTACTEFLKRYPMDPRHWVAKLELLEFDNPHGEISLRAYLASCNEIALAPDAPSEAREKARKLPLDAVTRRMYGGDIDFDAREKVFCDYERNFPKEPVGESLVMRRVEHYSAVPPEALLLALQTLTQSPNESTAKVALRELTLRSRPLALQFTSIDGKLIDLEKYRGKLVLLHFWSTSGNVKQESQLPTIKALRKKYEKSGFLIFGICLNSNREAMRKAIKVNGMNWVHCNDVKDGVSAVADRFHSHDPQQIWLVDREGVPHEIQRYSNVAASVDAIAAQ